MTRRAEKRREQLERALAADFAGLPYQRFGCCADCDSFTYLGGRTATVMRCLYCHSQTRAAKSRARKGLHV